MNRKVKNATLASPTQTIVLGGKKESRDSLIGAEMNVNASTREPALQNPRYEAFFEYRQRSDCVYVPLTHDRF